MDMQDLQAYMSLMQPDWRVIPEQRVVRSYLEDVRESIDIDIKLVDTPPALERLMLIRQNEVLRAHVRALLSKVR